MRFRTPFILADAYKLSHWIQYPEEVKYVYANFTPRKSMVPEVNEFVFFGLQAFLKKLHLKFEMDFFNLEEDVAVQDYVKFYSAFFLAPPVEKLVEAVRSLHKLGHLPLHIMSLPEGSVVNHGVPVLVVTNTHPEFNWVTNFIESWMSNEDWGPCTSATTARMYKKRFLEFASKTSDEDFMPDFQGHDFSFRGMNGLDAAMSSGAGHLVFFKGTDTCPALNWIDEYYGGSPEDELIGTSVPATEHSVMCAGGEENEIDTFRRLLKIYPTGILSVVSDTWDFWKVVTQILPEIKSEIMARDGKLVIRPDSSPKTPVEIICGDPEADPNSPEGKGLIQCLYEIFGGTKNSKGYIQLDSHIGAIYGDSITPYYQLLILQGLEKKGFSTTNVVLGIGSFTYQFVTRDTHGQAMKSTSISKNGTEWIPIFKDPKTDKGGKKSARGLLAVYPKDGRYVLKENATVDEAFDGDMAMRDRYHDGRFFNHQSFSDVRKVALAHG